MRTAFLLILCSLLFSCNKLEIEEDKPQDKPSGPDLEMGYTTVEEALNAPTEEVDNLVGYIVGYIQGNSIQGNSKFALPTDQQNTNMLLADDRKEKDPLKCIPVKLEKSGKYATRDELNLLDHPEFFHQKIVIDGSMGMYFKRPGVIHVYIFEFIGNEEEGENEEEENEKNPPGIDEDEQFVPEGRSLHF